MATNDEEKRTDEAVTVEQESRRMLVRVLGSFLFVAICGVIITPGGLVSDPPQVVWGVAIVGVVFFGFTGFSALHVGNVTYEWSKKAVGAAFSRYEEAGRTLSTPL